MSFLGDFELQVPRTLSEESIIRVDTDAMIPGAPDTGNPEMDALLFGARINRRELLQMGGAGGIGKCGSHFRNLRSGKELGSYRASRLHPDYGCGGAAHGPRDGLL